MKSVEYYLSKGFDERSAIYFSKGRRKPLKVVPNDNYTLEISFDNNEQRLFDVNKLIKDGTVYSILRNKDIFKKCYIDSNFSICWDKDSTIDSEKIWSNKIDVGADTCYLDSIPLNIN